ncbi:hypothetical protein AB0395_19335 [Streptosporangium sp. NPDC051023]|uniref:hypothetical protein n=1 Tax=Streptosporangium sp. NPDC051023 TaxID=3155410 RepID=UPI00344C901A
MNIRRLPAITALAAALTIGALAGAAPVSATAQASSTTAQARLRVERPGPFATLEECQTRRNYVLTHVPYYSITSCQYSSTAPAGYYFTFTY